MKHHESINQREFKEIEQLKERIDSCRKYIKQNTEMFELKRKSLDKARERFCFKENPELTEGE